MASSYFVRAFTSDPVETSGLALGYKVLERVNFLNSMTRIENTMLSHVSDLCTTLSCELNCSAVTQCWVYPRITATLLSTPCSTL